MSKNSIENKLYLYYDEDKTGGEVCAGEEGHRWANHEPEHVSFDARGLAREIGKNDWVETVNVDFDPKNVNEAWLVVVRYQTGDTFGYSTGNWNVIGIYDTYDKAYAIEKSINDGSYTGYKCWEGYFERFEGVEVERMDIVDKYDRYR